MILTTNTPYPLRKIRRIRACTYQRPQRKEDQYTVSKVTQYVVFKIYYVNILEDIKLGPYSKKLQYAVSNPLDTPRFSEEKKSRRRQSNAIIPYETTTESRLRPYHFNYPERSLTIEEMLNKFIDEGKQEYEEMKAFIYDFQTNNELLFKERNNSLIELRFGVQELLNVINNVPMIDCEVKGATTRGGKTTTQDVHNNDTNGSVVQPSNKVQPPPVPFPKRLRKEKDEAQQKKFLENLKQLHINLPFIEALAQVPKYAKFLKGLLTNKIRLEEACKIIMNERCSAVLLNKLPSKEKDLGSFTIPCDIGQLHIDNALADLGASISLIP
ncbi:hypothetical protein Tco_1349909 [Tanacetum coccineum]